MILVTGGTGFLGTFVVSTLLANNEKLVVLDTRQPNLTLSNFTGQFSFIKGSINDSEVLSRTMRTFRVDRVIHLASLLKFACDKYPERAIEINVNGTLNLLEACRLAGVKKIVFASSPAMMRGSQFDIIDEKCPIFPNIPLYGATKFLCEVLLERYYQIYRMPFIALRYWGVYGPGEGRSYGMGQVIRKITSTINGNKVVVEEVGAKDRNHFTFVKDAAQATLQALWTESNTHRIFNIAGGNDSFVTFAQFHHTVREIVPSAEEVLFKGKGQDRGKADISLAERELGYIPKYTLCQGIKEYIDFLREISK